jgi:hypothetical protein
VNFSSALPILPMKRELEWAVNFQKKELRFTGAKKKKKPFQGKAL